MAMGFKLKLSYHIKLFLLLLLSSWILVGCFVAYQYRREKEYKIQKLNGELQLINKMILSRLGAGMAPLEMDSVQLPLAGMRISIFDLEGKITYDNTLDTLPSESHLHRPEIERALVNGSGFTVRRVSATTHHPYFYSATRSGEVIVRSAVPYSVSLLQILQADRGFLWLMFGITLLISLTAYLATRRIGRTITRLNTFAERAEKGESIHGIGNFPHDELGSISRHIIRLYARLQRTMGERDREHQRALKEEQEKIRIKRQLTNNISHELKTPVATIRLSLETLIDHPDIPADKREHFLRQCYNETDRLTNLLNDVSTITRMEDGGELINKEQLDLAVIIRDAVEVSQAALLRTGISIKNSISESLPIMGNANALTSIFRNLIDNAIAYSGGTQITIRLESIDSERYVISVSDNGIGIPHDHLERVFERFYRIDVGRSRRLGGTGLGLSIVRNAVHLHGGIINATNVPGGGLKITFTLAR